MIRYGFYSVSSIITIQPTLELLFLLANFSKLLSFNWDLKTYEILVNFEELAQTLNKIPICPNNLSSDLIIDEKQVFLHELRSFMFEFVELSKRSENSLNKEEMSALVNLSKDNSIVISKADKGNAVMIQDSSKYVNKLIKLLEDKTKFECI